jgi:predicted site-specific integrase-resolvase
MNKVASPITKRRLDSSEAADFLGVLPATLANWRYAGRSPAFYRVGGKIIYDLKELEQWLEERRSVPTPAKLQVACNA